MNFYFTFIFLLLLTGCINTSILPSNKEAIAKQKIEINKISASDAQKAYIKLQKQREQDD